MASATVDQFAQVLSQEPDWYSLSVFLGALSQELDEISQNHRSVGVMRCLIEVYKCLQRRSKSLAWETIADALRRMGNNNLADKIYSEYLQPKPVEEETDLSRDDTHPHPPPSQSHPSVPSTTTAAVHDPLHPLVPDTHQPIIDIPNSSSSIAISSSSSKLIIEGEHVESIKCEFESLIERLAVLRNNIKRSLRNAEANLEEMQDFIEDLCGLEPFPQDEATLDSVFRRLKKHCSILNFHILIFLVESLLNKDESQKTLLAESAKLKLSVDSFKKSAKMIEVVSLLKRNEQMSAARGEGQKLVKLKVREFWRNFTMKQFEITVVAIFRTLYDIMTDITVTNGCICISWSIPDTYTNDMIPKLSLEFVQLIGVIYLNIGSDVIYNIEGDGCEVMEAAMIQAVELKNTQAVELFLALGCNPEVATTYDRNTAVTTVVNIRTPESKEQPLSSASIDLSHVCVFGYNKYVQAILDPEMELECNSCGMKEKIIKQLHQENNSLQHENRELMQKVDLLLYGTSSEKDAASASAISDQDNFVEKGEELLLSGIEYQADNNIYKVFDGQVVLPRQKIGIKAEMKVLIAISNNDLTTSGLKLQAKLTCNKEDCPVIDNNDETYAITVIPQQLGQHQLSIMVENHHIRGSPFNLEIIPRRDYTKIYKPVSMITNMFSPMYITFAEDGDMFVTSDVDYRIHVYDNTGYKGTVMDFKKRMDLQFNNPHGIDIKGDIVYVAEGLGHRIHRLTRHGNFIDVYGGKGSGIGQFNEPTDVKISADNKVYVADKYNDRIQVFNTDWSISHVIDGTISGDGSFIRPEAIAFDLLGNIHVVAHGDSNMTVFTPIGKFVRHYGHDYLGYLNPRGGIAIDSSGYCFISSMYSSTVAVYDATGKFVHSFDQLDNPLGVAISPVDDSLWIAEHGKIVSTKFYVSNDL